jgi:hypothetical protein
MKATCGSGDTLLPTIGERSIKTPTAGLKLGSRYAYDVNVLRLRSRASVPLTHPHILRRVTTHAFAPSRVLRASSRWQSVFRRDWDSFWGWEMLRPLRLSPAPAGVSLPNADYLRPVLLAARNDGVATFRACYLASQQFSLSSRCCCCCCLRKYLSMTLRGAQPLCFNVLFRGVEHATCLQVRALLRSSLPISVSVVLRRCRMTGYCCCCLATVEDQVP